MNECVFVQSICVAYLITTDLPNLPRRPVRLFELPFHQVFPLILRGKVPNVLAGFSSDNKEPVCRVEMCEMRFACACVNVRMRSEYIT